MGKYAQAEELYRQALKIGEATIGAAHPDYAIDLGNLGDLLGQKLGKVDEGRAMLEQAMTIFTATLSPGHPHIAEAQRRLDALPD